jgi:formylglycine-generating enzyme required for sulfatase activity
MISNIAAGEHQIKLMSDNYLPYSSDLLIEGREVKQSISVLLQPAWAQIHINSQPEGADVFLTGTFLGKTPLITNILQGEHNFRFEKDKYRTTDRIISVKAGNDQTLTAVKLFKRMGQLSIITKPSQVNVTYGNKYLGKTPLNVDVLPDVKQKLLLVKEGYQAISSTLLIPAAQKIHKNFALVEVLGDFVFNTEPSDALLYVDGRLMGRAKQKLTLAIKQQQIRIEKEGYLSYQTAILPNSSMEQVLNVELQTLEQAKWKNMKPVITASVGSRLKLFKPNDTFVMGASRREQGRRANEVKRTVQLSKAFYLGFTEVTNKEYRQFQAEHSSGHVKGNSLNGLTQPAVKLTWLQAAMFCNWLSAKEQLAQVYHIESGKLLSFDPLANGYRLPTEAEWVWAARYQQGKMLKYPWGEALPPKPGAGNFADVSGAPILGQVLTSYNDRYIVSAPVTSFERNDKGLFDLSGNVAEWLHDFYHIKTGLSLKVEQDPMGPTSGDYHVIRGASWAHGGRTELRLSFRDYGNEVRNDLGFRVARNAQ